MNVGKALDAVLILSMAEWILAPFLRCPLFTINGFTTRGNRLDYTHELKQ